MEVELTWSARTLAQRPQISVTGPLSLSPTRLALMPHTRAPGKISPASSNHLRGCAQIGA